MEQAADIQDWELLSSHSTDDPKGFESLDSDGDSYGAAIKSDYFALDSEKRSIQWASSEEESEEGGVDSDNPSWVDPDSDPRDLEGSSGEGEFRGSVFPVKNSGGFWSDGSSDCRSSPADSEKGEVGNSGDSVMRVSVEGIETGYQDSGDDEREKSLDFGGSGESEGIKTGQEEHGVEESGELVKKMGDGSGSGDRGDSVTRVGVEEMEIGHQDSSDDETEKRLDFGGSGESEGIETGQEEHGVEESGELVKMGDGSGSGDSGNSVMRVGVEEMETGHQDSSDDETEKRLDSGGSGESEGIETGQEEHGVEESGELVKMGDGSGSGDSGDSVMRVGVEGMEAGYQDSSDDETQKSLDFGGSGESEGIETGQEEHGVEESGELVKMGDGLGSFESVSKNEGEKRVVVWRKMPQDFIKFCVFKMRPVWSVPIAAAIMGLVVLGRKWYKMKHKKQSIQLKFAYDDKKASQLKDHAARLNEAFTVAKRVPVIRTFPASGVSAWPMVPLR